MVNLYYTESGVKYKADLFAGCCFFFKVIEKLQNCNESAEKSTAFRSGPRAAADPRRGRCAAVSPQPESAPFRPAGWAVSRPHRR